MHVIAEGIEEPAQLAIFTRSAASTARASSFLATSCFRALAAGNSRAMGSIEGFSRPSSAIGPVRVLVVDDHDVVRAQACAIIAATDGFAVVGEASSGEAALAAVRTLRPELVLMDVRMPGLGGAEAARELSAQHQDVVTFLMSADDLDHAFAWAAGAAAFVRKQELASQLSDLWNAHGPAARQHVA